MRVENSPQYLAEMEAFRAKEAELAAEGEKDLEVALAAWRAADRGWLPMAACPFIGLDRLYGFDGAILVADDDGKRALVTIRKRFGRPVFFKTQPEMVFRDGMMCFEGGEIDPRPDLPAWWWEWELTDEFGEMTYAGGEPTGKESVDFVPTRWTFLPSPPTK